MKLKINNFFIKELRKKIRNQKIKTKLKNIIFVNCDRKMKLKTNKTSIKTTKTKNTKKKKGLKLKYP